MLRQNSGVSRGIEQDDVAADFAFQFCGSAESHQISLIHDGKAVAAFGLFHQMRRDQNGNVLLVAQDLQILPEIAPGTGIKPRGRLVQQ